MKTTETKVTVMTTFSVNVELLERLRYYCEEYDHTIAYYVNHCALLKMRCAQFEQLPLHYTNRQWKPTTKIQVRLPRIVWEWLEMNCVNKSRFLNDAINEHTLRP